MKPTSVEFAHRRPSAQVARQMLAAFLFTFLAARITVYLVMTRAIPDLFLHLGGTHVHHLNYGIFLLAGVGACLLFFNLRGKRLTAATIVYGVGLGLTFDEFGMWLHLGGLYWQRASFDAVVVISAMLGLIATAPAIRNLHARHWATAIPLIVALVLFGWLLVKSWRYASTNFGPRFQAIERSSPR
jgi:hypothetical protein